MPDIYVMNAAISEAVVWLALSFGGMCGLALALTRAKR